MSKSSNTHQKRSLRSNHEEEEQDLELTKKPEEPEAKKPKTEEKKDDIVIEEKEVLVEPKEPEEKKEEREDVKKVEKQVEKDVEKPMVKVVEAMTNGTKKLIEALDNCERLGGENFQSECQRVLNELSKQQTTIKSLLDDLQASRAERAAAVPTASAPKTSKRSSRK